MIWNASNRTGKDIIFSQIFIHAFIPPFTHVKLKEDEMQLPMHTAFELSTLIIELWHTKPWANIGKQHYLYSCHHKWAIWMNVTNTVTSFCWSCNSCLCVFWSTEYFTLHSNKKSCLEAMLLWFFPFAYILYLLTVLHKLLRNFCIY